MSLLIIKILQFMVSNSFQNILMYAVISKMFVYVHVNRILLLIFEQLKILWTDFSHDNLLKITLLFKSKKFDFETILL